MKMVEALTIVPRGWRESPVAFDLIGVGVPLIALVAVFEGLEVVFIVLTVGANAGRMASAVFG
jgi:uncharacterized membrane protein